MTTSFSRCRDSPRALTPTESISLVSIFHRLHFVLKWQWHSCTYTESAAAKKIMQNQEIFIHRDRRVSVRAHKLYQVAMHDPKPCQRRPWTSSKAGLLQKKKHHVQWKARNRARSLSPFLRIHNCRGIKHIPHRHIACKTALFFAIFIFKNFRRFHVPFPSRPPSISSPFRSDALSGTMLWCVVGAHHHRHLLSTHSRLFSRRRQQSLREFCMKKI